jgi:hypothetical protein
MTSFTSLHLRRGAPGGVWISALLISDIRGYLWICQNPIALEHTKQVFYLWLFFHLNSSLEHSKNAIKGQAFMWTQLKILNFYLEMYATPTKAICILPFWYLFHSFVIIWGKGMQLPTYTKYQRLRSSKNEIKYLWIQSILYIKATVVYVCLSVFYLSLTSFDSWPLFLWYLLSSSFSQFFFLWRHFAFITSLV